MADFDEEEVSVAVVVVFVDFVVDENAAAETQISAAVAFEFDWKTTMAMTTTMLSRNCVYRYGHATMAGL